MAAHEDVSTGSLALWGVLGVLLLFVILLGLEVAYYRVENGLAVERDAVAPAAAVSEALANQRAELDAARVLDKTKGVYQIPIERAMERVVAESGGKP